MARTDKKGLSSWQIGLALLLGVFLIGMAASLLMAARRMSRVVDTDYYSNGLHYDQTRGGSKNAGLTWSMSASLAGEELLVRVKDRTGSPVAGGRLSFESARGNSGELAVLTLSESAPGLFRALRPIAQTGELHGTLCFTRGEEAASHKLVLFN